MRNAIIGALIGGILLWLWQFLSWTALDLHRPGYDYHPKQQEIMDCLGQQLSDDGFYFLPNVPKGASAAEMQELEKTMAGKPWALIQYHKSYNTNMGLNIVRGLLVDMVAAFLLCWVLLNFAQLNLQKVLLSALAIGLLSYLTTYYTNHIWYEMPTMPDLIDAIVGWGLVGLWLGWWLPRGGKK